MKGKLPSVVALLALAALPLLAQSQSINYTFQFSPPRDVTSVGGCATVLTENGQAALSGDAVCLSDTRFDSQAGFSAYFYQNTPNSITLEDGTLTYNGRVWNYTTPKGACTLSQYGPGSTFTDSYSNSFGGVNQGWSGPLFINGTVTTTKVYGRVGCSWELVHTTGNGTEDYNPQ